MGKLPPPVPGETAPDSDESNDLHGFKNYKLYEERTRAKDWEGIFELNNISMDSFGTRKELKVLPNYLEEDEVVFALASGLMNQTSTSNAFDWGTNTWLVALTNERFLFLDHAMLTSSVDTQSIRHDMVQAVSASQGFMFGKIQVDLGARTVMIDNCNKEAVKVVADLANKWLRVLKKRVQSAAAANSGVVAATTQENLDLLKQQVANQERIIELLGEIKERLSEG